MILVHGIDGFEHYVNEKLITSISPLGEGSEIHFDYQNFIAVKETGSQILKLINWDA